MIRRILLKLSHYWILGAVFVVAAGITAAYMIFIATPRGRGVTAPGSSSTNNNNNTSQQFPTHTVKATLFWVGEPADDSNAYIPNHESAWVGDWTGEYGGIDNPEKRCGYAPCDFTPKQNAFYIALPFNDIDADGQPKNAAILKKIPWYAGQPASGISLMKNRWVEITFSGKTAYGQMEDVGPMNEDDADYVFGQADPKFKAGIDLSPALTDYLGTAGYATVQWRFIAEQDVPAGPWRNTVTASQVNY